MGEVWFGGACPLTPRAVAAGERFEGAAGPEGIVLVRRGWVEVESAQTPDMAWLVAPGSWLGLEGFGGPVRGEAHALTAAVVCPARNAALRLMLERTKGDPARVFGPLGGHARASQRMEWLRTGTAEARLARLLTLPVGPFWGGPAEAAAMRRHILARILGIRPETLSRALRLLSRRRLLRLRPALSVTDLPGLRAIAGD